LTGPGFWSLGQNAGESAQYLLNFENISWSPFLPEDDNLRQLSTNDQTVRVIDPEVCKQNSLFLKNNVICGLFAPK
jgi:hypothetical protein